MVPSWVYRALGSKENLCGGLFCGPNSIRVLQPDPQMNGKSMLSSPRWDFIRGCWLSIPEGSAKVPLRLVCYMPPRKVHLTGAAEARLEIGFAFPNRLPNRRFL